MEAILCTCSPDLERYKEFVNNGADRIFMPLYTKAELLIIGRCIAKCDVVATLPSMRQLYTDESIRERFAEFGGIIRVVLPSNPSVPNESLSY
jgi:hypothetical protein